MNSVARMASPTLSYSHPAISASLRAEWCSSTGWHVRKCPVHSPGIGMPAHGAGVGCGQSDVLPHSLYCRQRDVLRMMLAGLVVKMMFCIQCPRCVEDRAASHTRVSGCAMDSAVLPSPGIAWCHAHGSRVCVRQIGYPTHGWLTSVADSVSALLQEVLRICSAWLQIS